MKVRIQTCWLPKEGSTEGEYEDAFSPSGPDGIDLDQRYVSVAIADGATETSFSRDWANDLATAYTQKPGPFYRDDSVAQLVSDLGARLNARIAETLSGRDVPWYTEQKASEGAFAALLGLTLWGDPSAGSGQAKWRAWALGDCCVFQIRHADLLAAFPLTQAVEFNNRPCLVSSYADRNGTLSRYRELRSGLWQHGDELLLMTDALACWFLRRWELRSDPLELLAHVRTNDEFAELVGRERRERLSDGMPLLRNDDVTLMRCLIH